MSWGIADTAPEIEKIKAESADYLHGLDSCGVIDLGTYNYAFDFYMDLLDRAYEQGKKDASSEWIPIKWRDCTDADREKYEFEEGITAVLDCEMPDNGQEILVTTLNGSVDKDTFYVDEDGYHSGSGWHDWDKDIIDIIAWRRLPEPYKKEGDA